MNNQNDVYELSNGVGIPCIGFGMWQTPDSEVGVNAVKSAIRAGYTHIDTAQAYRNEDCVGKAIRESGVDRKKLFITTKLWNSNHSYDLTKRTFDASLKELDTDYVDLFLIHWPNPAAFRDHWEKANADSWKAMEELYEAGIIRAIGVSNFRPHHIEALLKTARIKPMVNQIRLCPGETQDEVVDYCRSQGILLEAYSPLGTGKIFDVPEMKELAEKYGKSIAQICIRWSLQRGYLPLPKSVTPVRIEENLKVFDFELEESDVKLIAEMTGCVGFSGDPDTMPF
ncbi:MAG: aldo/keto reductase [Lachnospiraceae bacterium]|nr:aldo/keto reductase [Lachnospiraceae bacterium]